MTKIEELEKELEEAKLELSEARQNALVERVKRLEAYPKLVHELNMLAEFVRMVGYDGEQREAEKILTDLGVKIYRD